MLLPASPGSSIDTTARKVAGPLGAGVGQPVVVENVPGAGGMIGVGQIVRGPKDGYTFGLETNLAVSSYLYKQPFDPAKDVVPVSILATGPLVLVVNPKVPAKTLAELLKLAKSRTGSAQLTYGSAGIGSLVHLAGALMEAQSGAGFLHVPFKGQNEFTTALVGGQIDAGFVALTVADPMLRTGKLRALAVTSAHRSKMLPDVPTMTEAGLPGYELVGMIRAFVAAGTPPAIIQRLNAEIARALHNPEVTKFLESQGLEVVASTVEEAESSFKRDFEVYGKLAKRLGLKPEN